MYTSKRSTMNNKTFLVFKKKNSLLFVNDYRYLCTVNSLMFAGINVCLFETKPSLQGLIFAVSLGLDSYLDT